MSAAVIASAACCVLLVSFSIVLATGVTYIYFGVQHQSSPCDSPVATYAIVQGALDLATIPLICATVLPLLGAASTTGKKQTAFGAMALCSTCGLLGLALARLGVLIWGSIVVFGENRWSRYQNGDRAFCQPELYYPIAVLVIVEWVTMAVGMCNQRSKPSEEQQ